MNFLKVFWCAATKKFENHCSSLCPR